MSIIGKLKHMTRSGDARVEIVEGLLTVRTAALRRAGHVVVSRGLDAEEVRKGRGSLSAWVVYYDADPDLQRMMRLEIDSYCPGEGLVFEPAHATLVEEDQPSQHLLIADLEVYDLRRRNHSIGTHLIEAAKLVAAERGLPLCGTLSDVDDVNRLLGFYGRLGFETELYDPPDKQFAGRIRWAPGSAPS